MTDRPFRDEPTEVLQTALGLADTHARQVARFQPVQPDGELPVVVGLFRTELQHREGTAMPTDERRDRYAAAMAKRDGHEWPPEFEDDERDYRRRADAAIAVADAETAAAPSAPADRDLPDPTAEVRKIVKRLVAHAKGFQDVLDEPDRDPWARLVRADLDELGATLAVLPASADLSAGLAPMFEGLELLLTTSSRDWGEYRVDAWLYAVLVGWDCEQAEHDETCTHGAMEEMAARHGWDADTVAKARRYRDAVRRLVDEAQQAGEGGGRVVGYINPGEPRSYFCRSHGEQTGLALTPVTADDLPDGGLCDECGVDVLIPQAGEGR